MLRPIWSCLVSFHMDGFEKDKDKKKVFFFWYMLYWARARYSKWCCCLGPHLLGKGVENAPTTLPILCTHQILVTTLKKNCSFTYITHKFTSCSWQSFFTSPSLLLVSLRISAPRARKTQREPQKTSDTFQRFPLHKRLATMPSVTFLCGSYGASCVQL